MKVTFSNNAVKAISRLDTVTKKRVQKAIQDIPKGSKKMKGHTALYRIRVGDWRIVFSYPDKGTVLVEDVGLRGQIYKGV